MRAGTRSGVSSAREAAFGGQAFKPPARKAERWLTVIAVLAVMVSWPSIGFGAEKTAPARKASELGVTIRVYNYSQASRGTLEAAERAASRIIGKAGITATWLDCWEAAGQLQRSSHEASPSCKGPVTGATLMLRVLPRSIAHITAVGDTTFGYAIGSVLASVLYSRVEELAHALDGDYGRDYREAPAILGVVIAHELGHLLLGTDSHSSAGIMCSRWDRKYLRLAQEGFQTFSPEQSALMRATVLSRNEDETALAESAGDSKLARAPQ